MMESMEALATMFMHCTSIVYLNSTIIINDIYVAEQSRHEAACVFHSHWVLSFFIIGNLCTLRLQECMALHIT